MHLPRLPAPIHRLEARLPRWWWKAALAVAGVGLVAGVAGVGLFMWKRRGMLKIPKLYWQGAKPWGERILGFGNITQSRAGCLEVCITEASNALAGTTFDPGDVLDITEKARAFSGSMLELEEAAASVNCNAPSSERIREASNASVEDLRARIDDALGKGGLAIVQLSWGPDTSHFIIINGVQGSNYTAADPALAKYVNVDVDTLVSDGFPYPDESTSFGHVVGVAPIYSA